MEQTEERAITAHDRCDQCGAQAYFLSIFESGELYFCRHHFLKNEEMIRELAYHVVDQSGTLIGDM
jgi:ribosomal protein S14